MRPIRFVRVLRTSSSERFILQRDGEDFAAVDLHFLADGKVAATLVVLTSIQMLDTETTQIIDEIDNALLPDQAYESGDFVVTVVRGEVAGTFASEAS